MKELIEELRYNQKINKKEGLENRVDIEYMIERLKDINKNNKIIELIQSKIKELEERIKITDNENLIHEYSIRRLELKWLLDDIKELIEK